jgi:hypothetical protein
MLMLYSLTATDWRILRRLHLAGGSATWDEVRPFANRLQEERALGVLIWLKLVKQNEDTLTLTDRGDKAQVLGELEVNDDELKAMPTVMKLKKKKRK